MLQARWTKRPLIGRGVSFSGLQVTIRDDAGKVDKKAAHREGVKIIGPAGYRTGCGRHGGKKAQPSGGELASRGSGTAYGLLAARCTDSPHNGSCDGRSAFLY